MKLYYGADKILKEPVFGLGNPNNDYGLGFYLTPSKEAAFLWASQFENGHVMTYEVSLESLNILQLNHDSEEDILSWIALLAKNRFDKEERLQYQKEFDWLIQKFSINISLYDLIVGYHADDSYFAYSSGFVKGNVSIETLREAMHLGKLGLQYVLLSPQAFRSIRYLANEEASSQYSYRDFRKRTLEEYHKLLLAEDVFQNHFIRDIMRKYGK